MRYIWLTIWIWLLLPVVALAASAEKLAEARAEIAAGRMYTADALLQEIVHAEDATVSQAQEALVLQCMVYSGDVLGSVALMRPMSVATTEGSELKGEISRQLVLARRAFTQAVNNYLNATVMGPELERVKVELPLLDAAALDVLMETLHDEQALREINNTYADDPAPGRGLLSQVNLYSYYLALSDALPGGSDKQLEVLRRELAAGRQFDNLHFLDWAARVGLDMHSLLSEPNGPDLLGLVRRCDERILSLAGDDANNPYVKNARERAGKY